jgi:ribonucleoside-diphosphate reductase alpha chain
MKKLEVEVNVEKIRKRDGRIVGFDINKVSDAIYKAAQSVGGTDTALANHLAAKVVDIVNDKFTDTTPSVEDIQDIVETVLIKEGHAKTVKSYILYRHQRALERAKRALILGEGHEDENLKFSNNALQVLERRYLLKDENGGLIETPKQMVRRIAHNVAQGELNYGASETRVREVEEQFYDMIANLDFLPNTPTIMNAGTKIQQLSACFVLPVEDSMYGIFNSLKDAALIHKSGGGTGFAFSRLRPSKDLVKTTSGVASGPVSFMKVFDAATEVIKQGGKRRGANMAILRVDHPNIMDFIECKADMKTLQNFNISVAITDKFMLAIKNDTDYDLYNPRTKKSSGKLNAREIFSMILRNAWKNGDPGLVFIDEINRKHPGKNVGEIESTNPCGEQPLLPYESCNLGSINLNNFLNEDKSDMDWERLREVVRLTTRFLDNVIDMNNYPIPELDEMAKKTRKIGLGIMGFADVLYEMKIKYNSENGLKMAEKIMGFINSESYKMSTELAEERGTYPAWEGSDHQKEGRKMRNTCCTTIAPTGTIGMLAEASGGCEPTFAISYIKNVMDGTELIYTNRIFESVAKERGFYTPELMRKIAQKGTIQDFDKIPQDVKDVFVTAQDISPEWHVKMQAAFQKHVDSSISKTINFPGSATTKDIEKAYIMAWENGCKGITIYRDGSRDNQVLNIGEVKGKISESSTAVEHAAKKMQESIKEGSACKINVEDGRIVKTCE